MSKQSKKILIVSGPFSGRAWGAGQQDTYGLAKLLVELGHTVDLASYDYGTNHEMVERFERSGAKVSVFPIGSKFPIFNPDPATHPFFKLCASGDFKDFFDGANPDIVVGIQNFTFPVLKYAKKKEKFTVLRSHNIEYGHFLDMLNKSQLLNPINYLLYFFKYISEISSTKSPDLIFAINPDERDWYKKRNSNTELLPLCSLHEKLVENEKQISDKKPINLFYAGGTYNILPHLKGAKLLIEKIMPKVLAREPDIFCLHIFGSKLPQELADKCDGKNIVYRGYVEDYDKALEEMDVGVFPVFTGGGMKQKIFEPICKGFPVVAPKKVLYGYPLEHEKNILLADNAEEFADSIIKLKGKELRGRISAGALGFAKENFNKDKCINILCREIS